MTHMTIWSYCCKLTPFVANMSLFCTSMKNKHQPETWAYLKSGTINILQSDRAKSSRAQFAKLWELPSLFSPSVRNQLPPAPPVRSRCVRCSCCYWAEWATTHPNSLEPWYAGNQFLKPNPARTPPYSLSLKLQPNGWETLNCRQQTTSLHQHTKLDFLFSTLQNSYWKRNLLPIAQHGYKCWACFCLVNILPS